MIDTPFNTSVTKQDSVVLLHPPNSETRQLLGSLGVTVVNGFPQVEHLDRVDRAYVHHTLTPVAALAYSLISPSLCKGKLPEMSLARLIEKRADMDGAEIAAFAYLCGMSFVPAFNCRRSLFALRLHDVIEKYHLWSLYDHFPSHPAQGIDIKPTGYDWDLHKEKDILSWRQSYRALPEHQQMIAASIMWLYTGGAGAKTWMDRCPRKWHAADAISAMKEKGALQDWARMVALYPGW